MAKFRTNHSQQGGNSNWIAKWGIFGVLVTGLFYLFNVLSGGETDILTDVEEPVTIEDQFIHRSNRAFLPFSDRGQVIHHDYYSLNYIEDFEQAEWVAYLLYGDSLKLPWNKRDDFFREDPLVRTGSAALSDYRNSGYDRGHLLPSADFAYNLEAMKSTYLMSNMSPQARNFNKGIWRELEELTRGWAKRFGALYVVTGPILTVEPKRYIGENEVAVPAAFYKVLLDYTAPEIKGIAFVIPNEISYEPLFRYATSIDEIEAMTGIDFFAKLIELEDEEMLEKRFNIDLWEFNKAKFEQRINSWNN